MKTVLVYLTDKNGGKMFKEYVGELFINSAKKNIKQHIELAKKNPKQYSFLDINTLEIKIENLKNNETNAKKRRTV